jgi:hypothetical protein
MSSTNTIHRSVENTSLSTRTVSTIRNDCPKNARPQQRPTGPSTFGVSYAFSRNTSISLRLIVRPSGRRPSSVTTISCPPPRRRDTSAASSKVFSSATSTTAATNRRGDLPMPKSSISPYGLDSQLPSYAARCQSAATRHAALIPTFRAPIQP